MNMEIVEKKYIVKNSLFVRKFLLANFLPDKNYSFNYVFTLHFDTYELDNYYEKLNGALHKNKLRIRWYSDTNELSIPAKTYLENKIKKNNIRLKYRKEITLTNNQRRNYLYPPHWTEVIIKNGSYLQIQHEKPLFPVILFCYRRYRFYDPLSGSRISLDDDIRTYKVSPLISYYNNTHPALKEVVLEVKQQTGDLPVCLESAGVFKVNSFSKYERLLTQHTGE